MKKAKKLAVFILTAALATTSISALAACDGNPRDDTSGVAGTYTVTYGKSELTGNIRHTGYLTNGDCYETNTLVLKEDKTYEYTKYVSTDMSGMSKSAAPRAAADTAEAADENVLFSWTSAGDGKCTLDFNKDGTYKFVYTTYSMTETGTWTWSGWKMKITPSGGTETEIPMDADTHEFGFTYTAVQGGGKLTHPFKCASAVWGPVLGQTGSYTPTQSGGQTPPTPTEPDKPTYSGAVYISYKFTGIYTYDGTAVTLNSAEHCVWSEDWGSYQNYGFTNCSGTEKDQILNKGASGRGFQPLNHFGGKYYFAHNDDNGIVIDNNNPVKVIVNKADNSFDYVEESVFD